MQSAKEWAESEFGCVQLGDQRRTQRAVEIAQRMAEQPGASLPQQMGSWKDQKASYRLFDNDEVNHRALSDNHWQRTRRQASNAPVVLMIQDITELDYTRNQEHDGFGPIATPCRFGLMLHNTLAVLPTRELIGMAYQQIWARNVEKYKPQGETKAHRRKRSDLQSLRWEQAVEAIGTPPEGVRWVHVADRESDVYPFLQRVQAVKADFCIRVVQDRRLQEWEPDMPVYLMDVVHQLGVQGYRSITVPAKPGQPQRKACLAVGWQQVNLRQPRNTPGFETTLSAWVIRTWELNPPENVDALEWILLTSVPVKTLADALERIDWYACRPIVEEYHKCLKTGCAIERSQLRRGQRLQCLVAFLSILAIRLLQMRDLARLTPHMLATEVIEPFLVQIAIEYFQHPTDTLTLEQFWHYVARLGGFPARKSDGQPGWQRLWQGWLRLMSLAEGVRLAQSMSL